MFLSRLNEIGGDCEKIVHQRYIPKLPGKQTTVRDKNE